MSTPANLTFGDISTRVMNQLRMSTANSVELTKVQALINEVYRDIAAKCDWWWLLKRYPFQTTRKLSASTGPLGTSAGSVSVTLVQGSTTITFNDAVFNTTDLTGFKLFIPENSTDPSATYTILTWAAPPVGTLDTAYTGASTTSTGYILYKDFVQLPSDVQKVTRATRFGYPLDMKRIGIEEMERLKSFDHSEGPPQMYSVYDTITTGDPSQPRKLVFHPYSDKFYRMDVWYKQMLNTELATAVRPLIPDDYAQVLIYGTLARGYPIFLNDLERGGFFQSLFNDIMALMTAQQREYASDHASIQPDMTVYRKQNRRPRTAFTLGNWFDTLPNQP